MTARTAPAAGSLTLDVSLLGREYKVACTEGERAALLEAAALLERRFQEIRASGKVGGTERIAVMAALNLADDLLRERAARPQPAAVRSEAASIDAPALQRRISAMRFTIDQTLAAGQEKLA
jgi:cell division protein ZapA